MVTIVISAINLRNGGTLSILNDFMREFEYFRAKSDIQIKVILLCHSKNILSFNLSDITVIEYPKSIKSYFFRIYYEYITFYFLSKRILPDVWFSLHDMTPNVKAKKRFVYCHNPSPFYKISLRQLYFNWKEFLFARLYKYVYKILIHKNAGVIVQQNWLGREFKNTYKLPSSKIIVARPNIRMKESALVSHRTERPKNNIIKFIYPSLPRSFKNFELILAAVNLLNQDLSDRFEVDITLSGQENKYAKYLFAKYGHLSSVNWIGFVERQDLLMSYHDYDAMVFCSKLETFGMPIEEFKVTGKPLLLPDLPYAHETLGDYQKAMFFDVHSVSGLSFAMMKIIKNEINFDISDTVCDLYNYKQVSGWQSLLDEIIIGN